VVILTAWKGGSAAYRVEQKVRARPAAQGVSLPFRFDVPATAPPSGPGTRWRLEFAPVGAGRFGRSAIDVVFAPAPADEIRRAAAAAQPHVGLAKDAHAGLAKDAHGGLAKGAPAGLVKEAPPASQREVAPGATVATEAYAAHIEKLAAAMGAKLTQMQRDKLRAALASPQAAALRPHLDLLLKVTPDWAKVFKYGAIVSVVLYIVVPIMLSVVGGIVAAVRGL
jgi:hypothetical protein